MRLLKWWFGWRCFGFAFYSWPWLDRNPVLCFSRAGRDVALAFGNHTLWLRRAPR